MRSILDVGGAESHAETVTLDPATAARRILDQLQEWGYLEGPVANGEAGQVADAPR